MKTLRYGWGIGIVGLIVAVYLGAASASADSPSAPGAHPKITLKKHEVVSAEELRMLQLKGSAPLLFDARDKDSYLREHIEGAKLPWKDTFYEQMKLFRAKLISTPPDADAALYESTNQLPKDTPIVTYCNRNCSASAVLLTRLKKLGFTDVRDMHEGIQAWAEKGYPTVAGPGTQQINLN